jgi:preprotein translocase subunit SecG
MLIVFGILILVVSAVLGFIVLIQNPKGGGLTGSLGGFSNQIMGVKQSTDVMEKGTWLFAGILALLCLVSPAFLPKEDSASNNQLIKDINVNSNKKAATTPATTVPMQGTTAPAGIDTTKK